MLQTTNRLESRSLATVHPAVGEPKRRAATCRSCRGYRPLPVHQRAPRLLVSDRRTPLSVPRTAVLPGRGIVGESNESLQPQSMCCRDSLTCHGSGKPVHERWLPDFGGLRSVPGLTHPRHFCLQSIAASGTVAIAVQEPWRARRHSPAGERGIATRRARPVLMRTPITNRVHGIYGETPNG